MEEVLNFDSKRDFNQWSKCAPRAWNHDDVLDFVFYQAKNRGMNMPTFRGELFRFDGTTLCNMKRGELYDIGGDFGDFLYTEVQKLVTTWDNSIQENTTWKCKHPERWTNKEVLDWIFFIAALDKLDLTKISAERFSDVMGAKFCRMKCDEFIERDREYGQHLYETLQHLLTESKFVPPDSSLIDDDVKLFELTPLEPSFYDIKEEFQSVDEELFMGKDPLLPSYPRIPACVESFAMSYQPLAEKRTYQQLDGIPSANQTQHLSLQSFMSNQLVPDAKRYKPDPYGLGPVTQVPGTVACPGPAGGKSGSKTRLWKFMWDLLQNPQYNPEYIRWESKKDGIFRIVSGRSKAIAELWGKIKNNPRMTFDKLGRSLRWCRANNGLFSAIPKNGIYPKKLCFRFKTSQLEELQRNTCLN